MNKVKLFYRNHKKIIMTGLLVFLFLLLFILSLFISNHGGKTSNVNRGVKLSGVVKDENISLPDFITDRKISKSHCTEDKMICINDVTIYQDKKLRGEIIFSLSYDSNYDSNFQATQEIGFTVGTLVVSFGKSSDNFQIYDDVLIKYTIHLAQGKAEVHYGYDGYDFLDKNLVNDFQVRNATDNDTLFLTDLESIAESPGKYEEYMERIEALD